MPAAGLESDGQMEFYWRTRNERTGSAFAHSMLSSCSSHKTSDKRDESVERKDEEGRIDSRPLVSPSMETLFRQRSSSGSSHVKVNYFERIREKNNNFDSDGTQHQADAQNFLTSNSISLSSVFPVCL